MAIANTTKLTNQRCLPSPGIMGSNAITPEVLLTVTVNVVEVPDSTAGATLQVKGAGAPLQLRATLLLNPELGFICKL
jgi:hypothetical protein